MEIVLTVLLLGVPVVGAMWLVWGMVRDSRRDAGGGGTRPSGGGSTRSSGGGRRSGGGRGHGGHSCGGGGGGCGGGGGD